jgi:Capsule polysaccharide biosynthesis protein
MITLGPTYPDSLRGRLMRVGSALAREARPIDRLVSPFRRPLDRAWYRRAGKLRELGELGESVSRRAAIESPRGVRVLVVSLRMWTHHTAYESVIAQALRLRGAEVVFLTCGGGQPICELGWGRRVSPRPCDRCAWFTDRVASRGHFAHLTLAQEFPWGGDPSNAPEVPTRHIGDDTPMASVAWFAKSADPRHVTDGGAIERDFGVTFEAVESAFERVVNRLAPDVVFAVNGLFAAEHAMRSVAERSGLPVVTYELAPRKDALIFGREFAAPDMVMDGLADDQAARPLAAPEAEALDALLRARVSGEGAHERYFDESLRHEAETVRATLELPTATRIVSAFTNLSWDTALLGNDVAFDSQFDWLAQACRIVSDRDDTTLVVRVHPAEGRWGTSQPVVRELAARVGELPSNVVLVPPDQPLSSYGLLAISDLVLCYTTTVGLEAAVRGIPVAVAADTHYRGRGFTTDIAARTDLERVLAHPPTMSQDQIELARRYAFAFFFRLMIPFRPVVSEHGQLTGVPESAEELVPGRDPLLDFVCDRILKGGNFYLPPELALAGS